MGEAVVAGLLTGLARGMVRGRADQLQREEFESRKAALDEQMKGLKRENEFFDSIQDPAQKAQILAIRLGINKPPDFKDVLAGQMYADWQARRGRTSGQPQVQPPAATAPVPDIPSPAEQPQGIGQAVASARMAGGNAPDQEYIDELMSTPTGRFMAKMLYNVEADQVYPKATIVRGGRSASGAPVTRAFDAQWNPVFEQEEHEGLTPVKIWTKDGERTLYLPPGEIAGMGFPSGPPQALTTDQVTLSTGAPGVVQRFPWDRMDVTKAVQTGPTPAQTRGMEPLSAEEATRLGVPFGTTVGAASELGKVPRSTEQQATQAYAGPILDRVKRMRVLALGTDKQPGIFQSEGFLGRLGATVTQTAKSLKQDNPFVIEYESTAQSALSGLAKALGERGNLAQGDILRVKVLIPKYSGIMPDTRLAADVKLQALERIISVLNDPAATPEQIQRAFLQEVVPFEKAEQQSQPRQSPKPPTLPAQNKSYKSLWGD